ncbi:MAG: hypothetical protein WCF03_14985 [Nitrososphaeraceae archaeon]
MANPPRNIENNMGGGGRSFMIKMEKSIAESYHYNNTPKLHINSKRHTNYMCMGSSQEATVL